MTNHEMLKAGRRHVEAIMNNTGTDSFGTALVEECYTYTDYAETLAFLSDSMGNAMWDDAIMDLIENMLRDYSDMTV